MSSNRLFAVFAPGLEEQALGDLARILGPDYSLPENLSRFEVSRGGIEFDADPKVLLERQRELGVITRVLQRLDRFEARRFDVYSKKFFRIEFEKWIRPGEAIEVRVSSHRSRLRVKRAIQELSVKLIQRRLQSQDRSAVDGSSESAQSSAFNRKLSTSPHSEKRLLYVRIVDDWVTVSFDLSGREGLFKRGVRTKVGRAPLRETFANAAVQLAIAAMDQSSKFQFEWVEPMAGSGVFTLELLRLFENSSEQKTTSVQSRLAKIRIFESDPKMLEVCRQTVSQQLLLLQNLVGPKEVEFSTAWPKPALKLNSPHNSNSFSKSVSEAVSDAERVVIINPPWGRRLKGKDGLDASTLMNQKRLLSELVQVFQPTVIVAVLPKGDGRYLDAKSFPIGFQLCSSLDVRVGGIPVRISALSSS